MLSFAAAVAAGFVAAVVVVLVVAAAVGHRVCFVYASSSHEARRICSDKDYNDRCHA